VPTNTSYQLEQRSGRRLERIPQGLKPIFYDPALRHDLRVGRGGTIAFFPLRFQEPQLLSRMKRYKQIPFGNDRPEKHLTGNT
jgi:hypothetical protein